jgi:hypothetical protein
MPEPDESHSPVIEQLTKTQLQRVGDLNQLRAIQDRMERTRRVIDAGAAAYIESCRLLELIERLK